ncbi:flavin reductase family protein [Rhodococcus sp. T2V]|uniref:flavin reductase family protein n=1 Tax=Rhodococcus sp. T2V TaxID=3034164 RepID=UPI0023E1247E|nr:flavin reductase family protein [Rhodococcus sp. T2V]MDF3305310.1 flavin reductase family protein [Rhodococcus sp. T2V]
MPDLSTLALRRTFGAYATGVALIAADIDGRRLGMLANSFTSVSLNPPLVSMSFAHTSTTWPALSHARNFGISVLGAGDRERADLLRRPSAERLEGIATRKAGDDALLLPDAAATLMVERHSEIQAGDHVVMLFRVLDHCRDADADPLVFHSGRLHELAR